ncbi:uncharacterized protein [Mytilus edulis]|uniref:uncharacterized protein n=1 Tax=Mytilus edulis TaxID=6550 RepID=UPI0039F04924
MKSLVVLCCFVSVSLAFPGMFSALTRRDSTPSVAEAIQKTTSMVNKRTIEKRRTDGVRLAFQWIDSSHNGHINADEFSTFYANANIPGLTYSKSEWTQMFNQAMTVIDTNGNKELEMGEFRTLASMGMGK